MKSHCLLLLSLTLSVAWSANTYAQVAIHGDIIYTSAGEPIKDGMLVIRDGKISTIGKAAEIRVPDGFRTIKAAVVTPGLIDSHCTVGLSGILNYDHDQDQIERSSPVQPQLRALDAYNSHEELVEWVRSFGITTIHTGHAPGELISGQTLVTKTIGNTVDDNLLCESRALAATLASVALKSGASSPGTRGKMMAMLRAELIKAQEYHSKVQAAEASEEQDPPPRDLRLETLSKVLARELPLMITAHRAQDINNALRLAREFNMEVWLDGGAEAYLLVDEIKQAGVPVIVHPTMIRPNGEYENFSFETAATLAKAGIPIALQAGYEAYVPKTRVVLFEAGMAAANGLSFQQALNAITIDAARLLKIDDRVGSLEVGKDGDVALYDGDPFEYTSHCIGVVINGDVVSEIKR